MPSQPQSQFMGETLRFIKFLVDEANADVDQQIRHGRPGSALATAAFWGREVCVDLLITAGAQVNLKIENGLFPTALRAAQATLSEEDLQILRERWAEYRFEAQLERIVKRKVKVVEMLRLHNAVDEV